jgi:hypothetical protein
MNIGVTSDYDDVFKGCDSGCLCSCDQCKDAGTKEINNKKSLYEACEEQRKKNQAEEEFFERELQEEQKLYDQTLKENEALKEKLRQCCPDDPCAGVDCGQHGRCNQRGKCECETDYSGDHCEIYKFQCPTEVCINPTTGHANEQCGFEFPFVCYNYPQQPAFQWGCYKNNTSAQAACNNKICDTRSCNPQNI